MTLPALLFGKQVVVPSTTGKPLIGLAEGRIEWDASGWEPNKEPEKLLQVNHVLLPGHVDECDLTNIHGV